MKTISIKDDVYINLSSLKKEKQSFNDVIRELLMRQDSSIDEFFEVLKGSSTFDEIEGVTREQRKMARERI
jgi:predicted CopG family antitoxin